MKALGHSSPPPGRKAPDKGARRSGTETERHLLPHDLRQVLQLRSLADHFASLEEEVEVSLVDWHTRDQLLGPLPVEAVLNEHDRLARNLPLQSRLLFEMPSERNHIGEQLLPVRTGFESYQQLDRLVGFQLRCQN